MAIHNGNTDFHLVCAPNHSGKRLTITFRKASSGPNPLTLTVHGPGGGFRWTKSYMNTTDTESVRETVDVPAIAGYKVEIKTSRGYQNDWLYQDIKLPSPTETPLYTFTRSDVTKQATQTLVLNIAAAAMGLIARFTWPAAVASVVLAFSGFLSSTRDWRDNIQIIEGWSFKVRMEQTNSTTMKYTYYVYDQSGRLNRTFDKTAPILHAS